MFPIVGFLAHQILGIVGSQIEIERILFFSRHTYKPKEASFTIRKFRKIDFVNKNWPSDPKVGCKPPFNLVELIQTNLGFEEELERFEGSFE